MTSVSTAPVPGGGTQHVPSCIDYKDENTCAQQQHRCEWQEYQSGNMFSTVAVWSGMAQAGECGVTQNFVDLVKEVLESYSKTSFHEDRTSMNMFPWFATLVDLAVPRNPTKPGMFSPSPPNLRNEALRIQTLFSNRHMQDRDYFGSIYALVLFRKNNLPIDTARALLGWIMYPALVVELHHRSLSDWGHSETSPYLQALELELEAYHAYEPVLENHKTTLTKERNHLEHKLKATQEELDDHNAQDNGMYAGGIVDLYLERQSILEGKIAELQKELVEYDRLLKEKDVELVENAKHIEKIKAYRTIVDESVFDRFQRIREWVETNKTASLQVPTDVETVMRSSKLSSTTKGGRTILLAGALLAMLAFSGMASATAIGDDTTAVGRNTTNVFGTPSIPTILDFGTQVTDNDTIPVPPPTMPPSQQLNIVIPNMATGLVSTSKDFYDATHLIHLYDTKEYTAFNVPIVRLDMPMDSQKRLRVYPLLNAARYAKVNKGLLLSTLNAKSTKGLTNDNLLTIVDEVRANIREEQLFHLKQPDMSYDDNHKNYVQTKIEAIVKKYNNVTETFMKEYKPIMETHHYEEILRAMAEVTYLDCLSQNYEIFVLGIFNDEIFGLLEQSIAKELQPMVSQVHRLAVPTSTQQSQIALDAHDDLTMMLLGYAGSSAGENLAKAIISKLDLNLQFDEAVSLVNDILNETNSDLKQATKGLNVPKQNDIATRIRKMRADANGNMASDDVHKMLKTVSSMFQGEENKNTRKAFIEGLASVSIVGMIKGTSKLPEDLGISEKGAFWLRVLDDPKIVYNARRRIIDVLQFDPKDYLGDVPSYSEEYEMNALIREINLRIDTIWEYVFLKWIILFARQRVGPGPHAGLLALTLGFGYSYATFTIVSKAVTAFVFRILDMKATISAKSREEKGEPPPEPIGAVYCLKQSPNQKNGQPHRLTNRFVYRETDGHQYYALLQSRYESTIAWSTTLKVAFRPHDPTQIAVPVADYNGENAKEVMAAVHNFQGCGLK